MTNDKLVVDRLTALEIRHGGNWNRREFVKGLSALGGAAALMGLDPRSAAADPPPEITKLRLVAIPAICFAPQYVAEPLLRAEGFTDIEYKKYSETTVVNDVITGKADINMEAIGPLAVHIDAGRPIVALAGVHMGCYQLFGNERVRTIRDLKGKTVPVDALGGAQHVFVSGMAAYVGLSPRTDINWVIHPSTEAMHLFEQGKVDAFLGFPPEPQELLAKKIGHLVMNTATDRPWSHYYCCMLVANPEFVRKYPVATKRAMRAILKAADLCADQPERAARMIVDKKYTARYDYALAALQEVPYRAWRTHDPDDSLRFTALRLHEVGMIKSSPEKIITQGTDWRFLNELKEELKA